MPACDEADEEFIIAFHEQNYLSEYPALPYKASSFSEGIGALVCATRQQGEQILVRHARNRELEESWIHFPELGMWLNTSFNAQRQSVIVGLHLDNIALKTSLRREYFHSHILHEFSFKDPIYAGAIDSPHPMICGMPLNGKNGKVVLIPNRQSLQLTESCTTGLTRRL